MKILFQAGTCVLFFLISIYWTARIGEKRTPHDIERDEAQGRSGALEALDFWTRARAYPDKDIPQDKYSQAFEYLNRTFKKTGQTSTAISAWQSMGPNNLSGRAISVAVNPQNSGTIYVGSASGGLWRSYSGGTTGDWQRVATGYPVLGVGTIAINPTDSNTIYIGTGEVYRYQIALGGLVVRTTRGSFGMGILKSTNSGVTWSKSLDWSTQQQRGVEAIKMNPLNPHTLYAATSVGMYKTTNAGVTWNLLVAVQMGEDILISPLDTNLVLMSIGNFGSGAGVYRSSDGGGSWNQVPSIPSFTGKTMLEMFGANPNIVFADVADSTTGVGSLWKSTDFGLSWSVINNNPGTYQVQGWYSHFIAAHPTDPSQIFHASVTAIKSTDGGSTWNGLVSNLYSDNHAFAHDPSNPDILYVVNDDGPYRSTNFGTTFAYVGNNLQTGQFYNGFSNSASDSLLALGQVQDHIPGYIYHGSTAWGRSAADEVGWTAINQTNDNIMYAVERNGGVVARSTNRGVSFSGLVGFAGFGAWNSPLVLSPSNPNILYLGIDKIYKSTNAGSSFPVTNGDLLIDGGNPSLSMAISATNPDTVYVGTAPYIGGANLFRTTNGGTSWITITGTLPNRYPLDIATDPRDSRVVYATFGGFGSGHIFKSTDAGTSWSDVSGTLPDLPTGAVLVDPLNSNYVYVGNDFGVFASTNGGTSWSSFNEGLPEAVLVSDLSYSPSNRTLRVTTHGNGLYQRKLNTALPALSLLSPNGGESWEAGTNHAVSWGSGLVSAVRLDYSTDNGSTWLTITNSVPAANASYAWLLPMTLTSTARVRVRSLADSTLSDQSNGTFTIFFNGIVVSVNGGWNLISLPVTAADQRRSTLFPTSTSNAFAYDGSYHAKDTLLNGSGYWLKFGTAQQVSLEGNIFTTDTLDVLDGWNLIGTVSAPLAASAIGSIPPFIISSPFYGYNGAYTPVSDSLNPGRGYWIKTAGGGKLIFNSSSAQPAQSPKMIEGLQSMNIITITDREGHSQKLYFSLNGKEQDMRFYELPPLPPSGIFDVRFSTQRFAEVIQRGTTGDLTIELQANAYPLVVDWKINDAGTGYSISDGRTVRILRDQGSAIINQSPVNKLTLHIDESAPQHVPTEFALLQNYPNPFNPATDIRYRISEHGFVTLRIFDLIGKEIATLVNEVKEPGSYTTSWDAGAMPSGMYLYRLTSGGRSQYRRMLLTR